MKYTLLIFFFMSIGLSGQNSENIIIPSIQVNKNLTKLDIKLSDICSDISYTKLDFDGKYPVAPYMSAPYVTSKYILFSSRSKILEYTRDGKTVQMIGAIGKGPGEYLQGSSFVLDEKNNKIYIRANYTSSILVYDSDRNKFLYSFKIPDTEGFFYMANEGIILKTGSTRQRYSSRYFAWQLLNLQGKVVYTKRNSDFNKPKSDHRWKGEIAPSSFAWKDVENSFCSIHERGSDTIFGISDKLQIRPRFVIDAPDRIEGEIPVRFYAESSQFLFWMLEDDIQKKAYNGVYDKIKKESYLYLQSDYDDYIKDDKRKKLGVKNDIDGGLPVLIPVVMFSSSLWHFFIQPYDLIEYVNSSEFRKAVVKDPRKKDSLIRFVKTLQEDDNPVLVTLKLK